MKSPKRPTRLPWASLIWRVFLTDVLECGRCSGRMEIVAALTSKATIARVLGHLGLSCGAGRPEEGSEEGSEEGAHNDHQQRDRERSMARTIG